MRCVQVPITTNAAGGGTAQTAPVSGRVVLFRLPQTSPLTVGGSADFTITRANDGGTILALTNVQAAAGIEYPVALGAVTTAGGTTAYNTGVGPVLTPGVPVDGHINVVVAQGALSASGTAFLYVDDR